MEYQNKKILFVNDWGFNPNPRIFYLANFFKQTLKYSTYILGRDYNTLPLRDDLFLIKYPLNKEKSYPNNSFQQNVLRLLILIKSFILIIKYRPNLVYSRSLQILFFLQLFKPFYKFKIIYESHGFIYKELNFKNKYLKAFFYKKVEFLFYTKIINFCVVISDKLGQRINQNYKFPISNIFHIPNGVDPHEFKNINKINKNKNKFWIGFVGNWEHWIDIEDLLKISLNNNRYRVVVVGEGHNFKEMKRKYPNVLFTGKLPKTEALSYLNSFDICCSPWSNDSIFEEKSARKTFEYLYFGKPIIVSDVTGKENFLIENVNCLTYQLNDITDLKTKIEKLIEDANLLNLISKNNKVLGQKFVWNTILINSNLTNTFSS
tara:strand:- start:2581 stop:3708 length:1128 start_codon:yes stop_codon:yes gene_type:complete